MKKVLFIAAFLLLAFISFSQPTTQGTIIYSGANKATVFSKPSASFTKLFTNVIITVSIVDQGVNNPTVSITNNFIPNLTFTAPTAFPNPQVIAGRAYYTFIGNDNGSTTATTWTAGINNPIVELTFSNTNGFSTLQLNDLSPLGGPSQQMIFYVEVVGNGEITNTTAMMYGNGAVNIPNRAGPSFVPAQPAATVPVFLSDFNVSKQGVGNALLAWTTSSEQNVSHFVIERSSAENSGWQSIGQLKAKGNSNTATKYSFIDANVYDGRQAVKNVFYRIRSIDLDGTEKIFPIRSLRFSATGGKGISIHPNPAKIGFYVSVPIVNPNGTAVKLSLLNRIGQVVHSREINSAQASNYYYDIKSSAIAAGEYMLQVVYNNEVLDTKKIIIAK